MVLVPAWDSTLLKAAVYYDALRVLEIAFRSGTIYCYFGVPAKTYQELLQAESKGRYFNSHIRSRFDYAKIHPGEQA